MLYQEQDVNLDLLKETLTKAFFKIHDVNNDSFIVVINNYKIVLEINEKNKLIKLSTISFIRNYENILFEKILNVINDANHNLINVSVSAFNVKDKIYVRIDQDISYYEGMIVEQFIFLLKTFDNISHIVHKEYILEKVIVD